MFIPSERSGFDILTQIKRQTEEEINDFSTALSSNITREVKIHGI